MKPYFVILFALLFCCFWSCESEPTIEEPISWISLDPVDITQGEQLFKDNCMVCHNKNMRDDLTGPALGMIHRFREQEWLFAFTRQSQKMMNEGDPLSLCIWKQWKPVIMGNYDLTNEELVHIYSFIAHVSREEGLLENEMRAKLDCNDQ